MEQYETDYHHRLLSINRSNKSATNENNNHNPIIFKETIE